MNSIKKLLISLIVAACTVCFIFGIVGCNDTDNHVHSFSEEWMSDATGHWHEATCEHTDEKGSVGTHIDEDNNGKCDICDYTMQTGGDHQHTFAKTWSYDGKTHWHAATCNDTNEKRDEAPHVDEDGDQFCDLCTGLIDHDHTFNEEEWIFDLDKHWHPANCGHAEEKGGEAEHSFDNGGVCECGLKQEEVTAYNTLIDNEILDGDEVDFYTWLTGLKADGTAVRVTAQGDVVYDHSGNVEGVYVTERTVKVKAVTVEGDSLEHVWFKVAYSGISDTDEHSTNALAVAETGADGVAEITFDPIGGYTTYNIMLAEAKDVAALTDKEESEVKVKPNRYIETSTTGKGEVCDFTVGETDDSGTVVGQMEFKYDVSWAASDKRMLTYERYYADPVTGAGDPIEKDTPDTFTATGDNTFDYLLFSPAHGYDWSSGNTTEDFDAISENFRKSASGVYEISFTVTGGGSARLYYWDGIDLSIAQREADDSPSHTYVKSVSGTKPEGSDIADEMFTGTNKVAVTIKPAQGLSEFQLGIVCQDKCQVTITVKRVDDYVAPESGGVLTVGENTNDGEGYTVLGYDDSDGITEFTLQGVEPGLYYLNVGSGKTIGAYKAYCRSSEKTILYLDGEYKGVIRVNEGDTTLYLQYGLKYTHKNSKITLTPYTASTVGLQTSYIPASGKTKAGDPVEEYEIGFDETVTPGQYRMEISTFGEETGYPGGDGNDGTKAVIQIGGRTYQTSLHNKYMTNQGNGQDQVLANECEYYGAVIDIKAGEKFNLYVTTVQIQRFTAKVKLVAYDGVTVGDTITIDMHDLLSSMQVYRYTFNAPLTGTYKITLNLVEQYFHGNTAILPDDFTDGDLSTLDVKDEAHNIMIIAHTRAQGFSGAPIEDPVRTLSGTFTMEKGETITLAIDSKMAAIELMKFSFTIEFVE